MTRLKLHRTYLTHLIAVVMILHCMPVFGQFSDSHYFSREELEEDLQDLVDRILDSHTDPFAFTPKEQFYETVSATLAGLPDSATVAGFLPFVADVLNVLRDSHTCLDYGALLSYQFAKKGLLMPLRIISSEDGLFVRKDRTDVLPEGARLLSINGHSADSLWQLVSRYACIEGEAHLGRRRVTDAVFSIMTGFHVALNEKFLVDVMPVDSPDIYRYTYRPLDEKRWKAMRKQIDKEEGVEPVGLDFPESGIAHLKVETFAPDRSGRYGKTLRKSFQEINRKETETLIIDLRDNGGGSSTWVEYLYSFIDAKGYNTPHNIIGRNSELSQSRYRGLNNRFTRLILQAFRGRDENIRGMLSVYDSPYGVNDTIYFSQPYVQRQKHVFTGKVCLLINGLTASASVDFSNHFRRENRGLTFGEACFGPTTGTWGNPARHNLPNTDLPVFIATIRYNYDPSFRYETLPIQPDVFIPVNPAAIARGDDYPLQFLLDYLSKLP